MSKLIVEMKMPKDCPMCPMAHYNKLDEFTGCEVVAGKLFAATRDKAYVESDSRPDWCPIIGVLPEEHGDSIDRDKLKRAFCNHCDGDEPCSEPCVDIGLIETAPTVIAAERKDDEVG